MLKIKILQERERLPPLRFKFGTFITMLKVQCALSESTCLIKILLKWYSKCQKMTLVLAEWELLPYTAFDVVPYRGGSPSTDNSTSSSRHG
jgi:hypothetical protein